MSTEATNQLSNDERRQVYGMQPWTREGRPFAAGTLSNHLTSREFPMPWESLVPSRYNVVCIDDRIVTRDYQQRIVPISGSGAGESVEDIRAVLSGISIDKFKPHRHCGKAALVTTQEFARLGMDHLPTQAQIDWQAIRKVREIVSALGYQEGRMLGFDDRITCLEGPTDYHPADGAVVGLSQDFLHNLIQRDQEYMTPVQFRLAGHYYHDPRLHRFAVREAMLATKIASSEHGVGVISRGFRFTALVNETDPRMEELVFGAIRVFELLEDEVSTLRQAGDKINAVHLDILSYAPDSDGNACTNRFATVETF